MPTHKFMLALADLMFILTTIHICLLLYETFTASIPPRILQTAVAVAQVEVRALTISEYHIICAGEISEIAITSWQ